MRKTIAIFLITLYSMMLIVSYIPYIIYYGQQFLENDNITIIEEQDSKTLIGDACYLNALIKRSVDSERNDNKKAPPPPNIELSHSMYIYSKNQPSTFVTNSEDFNFKAYIIYIKETFLIIESPPPKTLL